MKGVSQTPLIFDVISKNLMEPNSRSRLTAIGAAASLAIALPACERKNEGAPPRNPTEANSPANPSIQRSVEKVVAEILGANAPKITPDSRFVEDLGADSLDAVEIVMALEEEFDLMIADEAAAKMAKVSDVTTYISQALEQRPNKR
jgi:acyl carrier protein